MRLTARGWGVIWAALLLLLLVANHALGLDAVPSDCA